MAAIVWFNELSRMDVPTAGGKGAQLGEMTKAGFPVPPGFVITAETYRKFLEDSDITEDINEILGNLDVNDTEALDKASAEIKSIIRGSPMPDSLKKELSRAYKKLSEESKKEIIIAGIRREPGEYVAVRSSATAEDLPDASFAGQQKTFLNIKGEIELQNAVKDCWASLFEPRAIFYRASKGFEHSKVFMSVIVQKMVDSEKSGVIFTVNPTTNNKDELAIEAAWGLGEVVVSGQITPDNYLINKSSLDIIQKNVAKKPFMYTRDIETGKTKKVQLSTETSGKQVLTEEEIIELTKFGKRIEEHYNFPQDIEWGIEDDIIYILQSRPVTTLKETKEAVPPISKIEDELEDIEQVLEKGELEQIKSEVLETVPVEVEGIVEEGVEAGVVETQKPEEAEEIGEGVLVKGFGASPGVGAGKVKIVHDIGELSKVEKGDVLVTEMTTPDMVPAMERAVAIVTNSGGLTCHASIVSRELGIPCIVGTGNATKALTENLEVTVDAKEGVVYGGIIEEKLGKEEAPEALEEGAAVTKTKLYVNLGIPNKAEEIAKLPVDGVGLMREEFIFASLIGEHPLAMIERGEQQKFIDILAEGIEKVARAFNPRPVVLRLSDFKTNEYRSLEGGEKFEGEEANPMMGWRGCSRYISEKYAPAFRLELKAVKKVRDSGLKNVIVMLPFVRNLKDVTEVTKLMEEEGLHRGPDLKLWMMAEVPSNIILADEFAKLVDGFSIGSNDLTQLIMGADRDSELLARLGYFDERDEAVKRAIARLIKVAHENNCTVSICGQAPSVYPEFTRFLVEEGIDSISINADVAVKTKNIIATEEKKISEGSAQ